MESHSRGGFWQTEVNGLWNHYFYGGSTAKLYHEDGTNTNGANT